MSEPDQRKRHRSPNGQASPIKSNNGWKVRPWVTFPDGTRRKVQGSGKTKNEALAAAQRNAEKALAKHAAERAAAESQFTLGAACERLLQHKQSTGTAYKTMVAYQSAYETWIAPHLGHIAIEQVTYQSLADLQSRVLQEKSSEVWRKVRTVIKQTLDVAMREGFVSVNPATQLPSVKQSQPSRQFLTAVQATAVITAARTVGAELRWLLALSTGMRQGECLGLRWENVDLESPQPQLIVKEQLQYQTGVGLVLKTPKTARSIRAIPLDPVLIEAFRAHKDRQLALQVLAGDQWESSGFVFTKRAGGPLRPEQDYKQWKSLLEKAGLDHVKLHSARHTAVSLMLASGVEMFTVSRAVGHTSILTTVDGYGHIDAAAVGAAVGGVATKLSQYALAREGVTPVGGPVTLAAQLQVLAAV